MKKSLSLLLAAALLLGGLAGCGPSGPSPSGEATVSAASAGSGLLQSEQGFGQESGDSQSIGEPSGEASPVEKSELPKTDLEKAKKELPGLISVLLLVSATVGQPSTSASDYPSVEIRNFVLSAPFYKGLEHPYTYEQGYAQIREETVTTDQGETYQTEYDFIPLERAQQAAHEFWGFDGLSTEDRLYDAEQDGFVIPDMGLNAYHGYKDLTIDIDAQGHIHTELIMTGSPGFPNRDEEEGRYSLKFQVMVENGHSFTRFLSSENLGEAGI